MAQQPSVIFLLGPTASGKTDVAVNLVENLPCEIVSVDSAMIYRGMDIGTAKPAADILQRAPHKLIDICDPAESYSAAQFAEDARAEIEDIHSRGKIPLLVGGTFLYVRALCEGLSPLPSADPQTRERIETQAQELGWAEMHRRLASIDPQAAQRIHPNDPQRIQRALEIYEITGESMSDIISRDKAGGGGESRQAEFPYHSYKIILAPSDRAVLHDRIAIRFKDMVNNGFIEEVRALYQRDDLHADLPSMRAVGYRQVWQHLDGALTNEQMIDKGIVATRQYAKRQFTWLRSDKEGEWYDALEPKLNAKILKKLLKDPNLRIKIQA